MFFNNKKKKEFIYNNIRLLNIFIKVCIFFVSISVMPHTAKAAEETTYSKCSIRYFENKGSHMSFNQNIRLKKFINFCPTYINRFHIHIIH